MNGLAWLMLFSIWLIDHCASGQNLANTQVGLSMPECSTSCPLNKRCVQDNATVVWELNSDNECLSYHSCYGSNSDYPDDTIPNIKFAGRFYPIVIALGSSVYFKAKYTNAILRPFTVYNVSQAMFLACKNATQVVGTLTSIIKLPDRFFSSVGYKFFIAKGRSGSYITCDFGLRLHVNVMDVTNCSGTPSGILCSGKGSCISESFTGDMYCECCSGFKGKYCEELDACLLEPCLHGNCSDVIAGHSQAFNCTCEPGYTGQQCDININECDLPENKDVCKNGAYCDDAVNSYVCLCLNGFHGLHCEFISNLCDFIKPCKNNANCSRVGRYKESYVCHCAPGFHGRNCTLNSTTSSLVPQVSSTSKTSLYKLASKLTSSAVHSYEIHHLTTSANIVSVVHSTTRFNTMLSLYSSVKSNPILEATSEKVKKTLFTTSFSELPRTSADKASVIPFETSLVHDSSSSLLKSQLQTNTFSGIRSADAFTSSVFSTNHMVVNSLSLGPSSTIVTKSHTWLLPSSLPLFSTVDVPSSTNSWEDSQSMTELPSSSVHLSSLTMSSKVSMATYLLHGSTTGVVQTVKPSVVLSSVISPSYQSSSVTMATSIVKYPSSVTNLPPAISTFHQRNTQQLSKLPSSLISPSVTILSPPSTLSPSQPPLRNQTCADNPCGDSGVCTKRNSSVFGLSFHCDCPFPTVGPVCNADLELHFPYFSGNSFVQYKPIAFGSRVNEFFISFRTFADGTILFSGHRTYRDFIKLEVVKGLLRFSVDAGDKVVSVTSPANVASGNTTSANFGYDTRTGTVFMSVNNGAEQRRTTQGQLRDLFLHYPLYLGGVVPIIYTQTKPDVGVITPFVGCLRELEFNERALELSDAVNWQNISECDLPACRAKPCKNSGICSQNSEDVSKYSCVCPYPYSGENCEEKYACAVNVCNGGKCLNSSTSGVQCLCPFGRAGVTCFHEIEVSIPTFSVVKNHSSYLQYLTPPGTGSLLHLRMDIKFSSDTKSREVGLLFYVGLHDHLSGGSDGDYLALGVMNNRMVLQYNLGSGAGIVTSESLSPEQEWFTILAGRNGREGFLYVDDQVSEGRSPPPLHGLNVFGNLFVGGVPESSMLNSEVLFTEGFRGTIKDPKIRTAASNEWVSLGMNNATNISNSVPVITGLNIHDQKVNACVVGACLNNGSCESLGASYVCQCSPEWSGMMCNDTSVPCREYNPCHGRSTCRMRDSGFSCDCPLGKEGRYCENDFNITTPFFGEYSYMSLSLDKVKIHVQTSITLVFSTSAENGILFYVTHDITTHSGDFLSITLYNSHVFLIYNLGNGIAKCRSQTGLYFNRKNSITVARNAKTSSLKLNGNEVLCSSRGGATQLNVASVFYLGGVPDLSQVQPMAYENSQALRDFSGCVEELKINGRSFDLTQRGVLDGRNIVNCDRSLVQVFL